MVVFLFPCGINGVHDSFKIFRSEHDIFTNLQCSGDECTESHCQMFGANCVSDGNCKYCICNKSRMNTFIRNEADPTKGECKRDEEIVPESGALLIYSHRVENSRLARSQLHDYINNSEYSVYLTPTSSCN